MEEPRQNAAAEGPRQNAAAEGPRLNLEKLKKLLLELEPSVTPAIKIAIGLVTVGSEQLVELTAFRCPCPDIKGNSTANTYQQNYIYGLSFIIFPAFAIFALAFLRIDKAWKLITGCWWNKAEKDRANEARSNYCDNCCFNCCFTFIELTLQASIAPLAWVCAAILDGDYYACAMSKNPYSVDCSDVLAGKSNQTSDEFKQKKQESQIIGWGLIAGLLLAGLLLYTIFMCCSRLTYYQLRYAKRLQNMESEAFDKEENYKIDANANAEEFFRQERTKSTWDKISTVKSFVPDANGYVTYSGLDKWRRENDAGGQQAGQQVREMEGGMEMGQRG